MATVVTITKGTIDSEKSQLSDLVGLKKDGQRVSLEGVLTGAALGLVVLFLQGESVEAAQGQGRWPGDAEGWPGNPAETDWGGGARGEFKRGSTGRSRQSDGEEQQPESIEAGQSQLNGQGYSHGAFKLQSPVSDNGIKIRELDLDPALTSPNTTSDAINGMSLPRESLNRQNRSISSEPIPTLIIRVANQEEVTSRSIEGPSTVSQVAGQVGMANARLDLGRSGIPNLLIESNQGLHALALSINDKAELWHVSTNTGLLNSLIIRGPEAGTALIRANQIITLVAHAQASMQAHINANLTGMANSRLVDEGGDDTIDLETNQNLEFSDGAKSAEKILNISLSNTGMVDSAIIMGAGSNIIMIKSDIKALNLALNGFLDLKPHNMPWGLRLQARSVGMENSLLDSGAGSDQVVVAASIDPTIWANLETSDYRQMVEVELKRIAALKSSFILGQGDDALIFRGEVIDSNIDLGSGNNHVGFTDAVANTIIRMDDSSRNTITLANQANSLELYGGGFVEMYGGAAEDIIKLNKAPTAGLLNGADGSDQVQLTGSGDGGNNLLRLDSVNRGIVDKIEFNSMESIALGSGDDMAIISPEAYLTGILEGGEGCDVIDYSRWRESVSLAIQPDMIEGIGQGNAGVIEGFEQVIGGKGNDRFMLSGMLETQHAIANIQLRGGPGIDQFIWNILDTDWSGVSQTQGGLPTLADLELRKTADGGIGLSDQIGWFKKSSGDPNRDKSVELLTASNIGGLGDSRLLPIAPIEQLLAGQVSLGAEAVHQLAIGITATGAELIALGPQSKTMVIAHLPAFLNGCCGSIP